MLYVNAATNINTSMTKEQFQKAMEPYKSAYINEYMNNIGRNTFTGWRWAEICILVSFVLLFISLYLCKFFSTNLCSNGLEKKSSDKILPENNISITNPTNKISYSNADKVFITILLLLTLSIIIFTMIYIIQTSHYINYDEAISYRNKLMETMRAFIALFILTFIIFIGQIVSSQDYTTAILLPAVAAPMIYFSYKYSYTNNAIIKANNTINAVWNNVLNPKDVYGNPANNLNEILLYIQNRYGNKTVTNNNSNNTITGALRTIQL